MYKNFNVIYSKVSSKSENNDGNKKLLSSDNLDIVKSLIVKSSEIRGETLIIKLPYDIINNDDLLSNFSQNVYLLNSIGVNIIIIHDHHQILDDTLKLFGLEDLKNHHTNHIIEMILSGYINKKIVSHLSNTGCMAIGISGRDGNLIEARQSKKYTNVTKGLNNGSIIDLQFINKPILVNPEILINFEDARLITVISPVATGPNNSTCIVDVDITSAMLASSIAAKYLVFLTKFQDSPSLVKSSIYNLHQFKTLVNSESSIIDKQIAQATIHALDNHVEEVRIINSEVYDTLIKGLILNSDNIKVEL